MIKSKVLLMLILVTATYVQGQSLQLGISGSLNQTFFHSSYNDEYYDAKGMTGTGVSLPAHIKLNENWALRTGFGLQRKRYHFEQNAFNFPNVIDGTGDFYYQIRFNAIQVPVLLCFSPSDEEAKRKLEFKIGCVLTHNTPKAREMGFNLFEYTGSDSINFAVNIYDNWNSYLSPDLYVGISLFNTRDNLRRNELTLSYQYGLASSTSYLFISNLMDSNTSKDYQATISPNLSYVSLALALFPKWLNLIKERQSEH